MEKYIDNVNNFLSRKNIAIFGFSRSGAGVGNLIYQKFKDAGYRVYAITPHAAEISEVECYPDLKSVPDSIEAAFIATSPDCGEEIVRDCIATGVKMIWFHRAFGPGSVSQQAAALARQHHIRVIDDGCPMMHIQPVDFGHRCIFWILKTFGRRLK